MPEPWGTIAVCAAVAAVAAAVAVVLWDRHRLRKTMDGLADLVERAMSGAACEETFDESRRSALETRLAQHLAASQLSARRLARERDRIEQLLSDISHQTKTPIADLLLYTELLAEEELTDHGRAMVGELHAQAEKLRFLIDALVKLSRLETGVLALRPQREALRPLLEEVCAQFRPRAEAKGLALILEDGDADAVCDAKWTVEAVGNLVDNAIKYTAHGEIRLSVRSYELFSCICVADTGMGISEADQAQIFGRFYRAPAAARTEGVGLGLHLTREIAAGQGGYVKVVSAEGQGAAFSLYLPRDAQRILQDR